MSLSEILMAVSTIAWCQNMSTRSVTIYAIFVSITAIGKHIWERL